MRQSNPEFPLPNIFHCKTRVFLFLCDGVLVVVHQQSTTTQHSLASIMTRFLSSLSIIPIIVGNQLEDVPGMMAIGDSQNRLPPYLPMTVLFHIGRLWLLLHDYDGLQKVHIVKIHDAWSACEGYLWQTTKVNHKTTMKLQFWIMMRLLLQSIMVILLCHDSGMMICL